MEYTPEVTNFTLWAPTADEVRLMLFDTGDSGHAYETVSMVADKEGTRTAKGGKDPIGKFYTFNVKIKDKWMGRYSGHQRQSRRSKWKACRNYRYECD